MGYSPCGPKESDTTKHPSHTQARNSVCVTGVYVWVGAGVHACIYIHVCACWHLKLVREPYISLNLVYVLNFP